MGSGNGWSGWYNGSYFRSLLELSYMVYLDGDCIEYVSAESSEYSVKYEHGDSRTYVPDFYLPKDDIVVEVKPKRLCGTKTNIAKFGAARAMYGDRFVVMTEDMFLVLSDSRLLELYQNGDIVFIDRYKEKMEKFYVKS